MGIFTIGYGNSSGPRPSFGSISLEMFGLRFVAFKKIEYSRTRSREMIMGAHPDPMGKTLGENAYKCTAELYINEFVLFLRQIKLANPTGGYGEIFFPINVQYNIVGVGVVTDTIEGCTIDSTDASNSQGPGGLTRTIEFNPTKIKFDGLDDVDVPLSVVTAQLAA